MDGQFTAAEVSRLAGFQKPWMLGHLEREQIFVREHVEDRRHGRVRKYTFGDLLILRAINRMLEMGARPARIRAVIRQLSDIEGLNGTREAAQSLVQTLGVRLFVQKDSAYLLRSDKEILDLTKSGQLTFGFMIDMHSVAREVANVASLYVDKKHGNLKVDMLMLDEMCREAGI